MNWHYRCPGCSRDLMVAWDDHQKEATCPHCRAHHYPPTPGEDHFAYVGSEHWPGEIEQAVLALRGTTCAVPGCFHEHTTLAHRWPIAKGGRTSVDNLLPMCRHHAREQGQQVYDEWLASLPKEGLQSEPPIEITITTRHRDEEPRPQPPAPPAKARKAGPAQMIASGFQPPEELPRGTEFVAAGPFLTGTVGKLALHYRCRLEPEDEAEIVLAAWPDADMPDLSKGLDGLGLVQAVRLTGQAGQPASGRLELVLPGGITGVWIAAVFLKGVKGKPPLQDFLLVGTE